MVTVLRAVMSTAQTSSALPQGSHNTFTKPSEFYSGLGSGEWAGEGDQVH